MELIKMGSSTNKLKVEHWKRIIQECNRATQSGEITKAEWLKMNHINSATFYRWQLYLRDELATEVLIQNAQINNELVVSNPVKEVEFVEVKPTIVKQTISTIGATLKYNQVDIALSDDISEELLSKIFKVIKNVE